MQYKQKESDNKKQMSERKLSYDYIRVIACICIIGIHATVYQETDIQGKTEMLNYILHSFSRIGLPVFFMLSGALILNSKKEISVWKFYGSRFVKMILPFVLYSLFYILLKKAGWHITNIFAREVWEDIITTVCEGIISITQNYQTVQLWFMYSIIGLYITAPFLKIMLQNMTPKQLTELVAIIFGMRCLFSYFPQIAGYSLMISDYIFSGWVIYFILGYYVVQDFLKPYYRYIVLGGLLVFSISMYMAINIESFRNNGHFDLAPHMMIQAVAFFIIFYGNEFVFKKYTKLNKIVSFISKYTFSMYMIQLCVLTEVNRLPIMNVSEANELVVGCLRILLVFVGSFIAAVVIDNIIIKPIQFACNKVGKLLCK